jgi:hypothetical protein
MIGGMATVALTGNAGLPLALAIPLAIAIAALAGLALQRFAVAPARGASVVTVIIITIGASILMRGLAEVLLDKNDHALRAFSGDEPLHIAGATLLPQEPVGDGGTGDRRRPASSCSSTARGSARRCWRRRTIAWRPSSSASTCGASCC